MARSLVRSLLCFLGFLLVYGLTSHASAWASDEIAAFRTGVELATRHDLIIDDIRSVQKITNIGSRGRGDHLYSKYFPGTALGSALLYAIAQRTGDAPYIAPNPTYNRVELAPSQTGARVALRLNALLGAFGMAMLCLTLGTRFDDRTAMITTLLVGLATDWWYESQLFYLEIGAGALLIASLYFAIKGRPWLASFCLGTSVLFRPTNIVALPIWIYAVWRRGRGAVLSAAWIAAAAAFLASYNWVRFGSPFDFGYQSSSFTTPVWIGLVGLLFSPGHSFFIYSPLALLAIPGAVLLWRLDKPLAACLMATLIADLLLIATWEAWTGGKVWGCRLLAPMLPLVGVPLGAAVQQMISRRDPRLIIAAVILGLAGLSIQLLAIVEDPAVSITLWTKNGYATVSESIWSPAKSWLALEVKSLASWNPCNIAADAIRRLWNPACRL